MNGLTVNRFECVLSTLLHEDQLVIPQLIGFSTRMAQAKFAPFVDKGISKPEREGIRVAWGITMEDSNRLCKTLKTADFLDNFLIGVGEGGFKMRKIVEAGSDWNIIEWETGAKWRLGTAKIMWAREYLEYPVESEDHIDKLYLPDPDDPSRYEGVEEAMRYTTDRGFFPTCSINGFFSGVWYYLRGPLAVTLTDMYTRKDFYRKLIAKMGEFNLEAEKNLLERGALMIDWAEDLGYNKGTFMNPKLYEDLIYAWHKKAIDLAHKHGAFVNMHSHGNINALIPLLVNAKLDVINPVCPEDNMDLKILKEKYGDFLCFQGGLSKQIGLMSIEDVRNHVIDRLRIGSDGSGFILSNIDLPYEMSHDNFKTFLNISRRYRRNTIDPKYRAT